MAAIGPSFKVGTKELFLPSFTISLLRTDSLPASQAKFHVPLWFSKLDLRDYLYHVYGVEVLAVRSYVKLSRVQSGKPNEIRPSVRRWHRPASKKFMFVDLARPFVWPPEPEDYSEWNQETVRTSDKEQDEMQKKMTSTADELVDEVRRERMRDQAKALLEGRAQWKKPDHKYTSSDMLSRTRR